MTDHTKIEWTDATWTDDRGRERTYTRADSSRPGQQLRRAMAVAGLRWCRGCCGWLPSDQVQQGACRPHLNAESRIRYAADGRAIRARVHARKRNIVPVPVAAVEALTDQFDGRCAYCPEPATTWDHVVPVATGGLTEPGNVVPACVSCNSSKKATDLADWAAARGVDVSDALDVLYLQEVA